MQKAEVLKSLKEIGLVPVLRAESVEKALALAEAIAAGGVTVLEITMTVPGAIQVMRQAGGAAAGHPDRRGNGAGCGDGADVHSGGREVCGQPGAEPEDDRDVPSLLDCGAAGRADADRDRDGVAGWRGCGEGVSGERAGRGEVSDVR